MDIDLDLRVLYQIIEVERYSGAETKSDIEEADVEW